MLRTEAIFPGARRGERAAIEFTRQMAHNERSEGLVIICNTSEGACRMREGMDTGYLYLSAAHSRE